MVIIRNIRWTDQYHFDNLTLHSAPATRPIIHSSPHRLVAHATGACLLVPVERMKAMRTTERILDLDLAMSPHLRPARVNSLLEWVRNLSTALRNRLSANSLSDLDDRLLNDVGLSRADVNRVLRESGLADDPSQQFTRLARRRAEQALRGSKAD
jgi:uncharacterized protein YjiS (DUF1127 family)